jgi:hypothetical protein
LGTAIALPMLDCMMPRTFAAAATPAGPKRMAFVFVPNGVDMDSWRAEGEGSNFKFGRTLEPLNAHKEKLLLLSGLAHQKAQANGDGGGDHARSASTFLTGCQAYKTDGANLRAGVSVDQYAAAKIGDQTRFRSLELGLVRGSQSGNCDSGYSCAYSSNISWKSPSTPMAKEIDPRLVFERLFADADAHLSAQARAKRQEYRQSVLDFVLEDARDLSRTVGTYDRRKLDEYLSAVREVETRIQNAERFRTTELPKTEKPEGIPTEYHDHCRLMFDLMVLAFRTDSTRVSTFMMDNEGSNKTYPQVGVRDGHHYLSHHGNDAAKKEKIAKVNRFHIEQFAYFLDQLRAIPEGEGNLLDNSMIVYGSAISDGNRHNHNDLPIVLAGSAGGAFKTGRHIKYDDWTPMNNLFLTMLDTIGAPCERLGDSTGKLKGLDG